MFQLRSFLNHQWCMGEGDQKNLYNPSTEEVIAQTSTKGLDFLAAITHARDVGGPTLRNMTFAERGALLKNMSATLHEKREYFLDISRDCNGATRGDSKFDVDGATATLSTYANYGKILGERKFLFDGEAEKLSTNARYVGQHIRIPRPGVAVHINAFNFPAWGTFEKIATAFLAGMPVITKPATATALLTYEMIRVLVESEMIPEGVLSFVAGSSGDLLDHLGPQDVVAFTGSAYTAAQLRGMPAFVQKSARFSAEADSLNAAVLGPDVEVGSDVWYAFIRNVLTDMRQKTGQKCTAVRRILVPTNLVDDVCETLVDDLKNRTRIGYPTEKEVTMGPVASYSQLQDIRTGIQEFSQHAKILTGGAESISGKYSPEGKGYFVSPTLFLANDSQNPIFHEKEIFGPCSTIIPYDGDPSQAVDLVAKGEGCLVSSLYTSDSSWLQNALVAAASWNGRLVVINSKVADGGLPPGMVLPNQVHGGPGRAGGGEELGGLRGMDLYTNRVAIQGDRGLLSKILGEKLQTGEN